MKSLTTLLVGIVITAGICWRFPLFHVVTMKSATAEKVAATFNATQFAESFWTNQLLPALPKSSPAEALILLIQTNPAAAKQKYSRGSGLGDSYFYFVAGAGKIVATSEDEISIAVTAGSMNAEISLQTGLIFGNALRDGTGLLSPSDYPNSQDFNDISAALNHIVETNVQPKMRERARVGANISFAGCAEVNDEATELKPLKVIPIQAELQKN
jgi:predicted lipoprotein